MQTSEEYVVPLTGPGYVSPAVNDYLPGEYRLLINTVITPQGSLVKRPAFQGMKHNRTVRLDKIIGHTGALTYFTRFDPVAKGDWLYVLRPDSAEVAALGTGGSSSLNVPTMHTLLDGVDNFTGNVGSNRSFGYLDIFRYDKFDYFLLWHSARNTLGGAAQWGHTQFHVVHMPSALGADGLYSDELVGAFGIPSDPLPIRSETTKWTYHHASAFSTPGRDTVSALMHKDRYVVAFEDTLYFSKAGNPTKFLVVDGGGFWKLPGVVINKIIAVDDTIYAISDSTVHAIRYSTDPNVDSQVTLISEVLGGQDAVLYGSDVYLINSDAVYILSGGNISKWADLNLGLIPFDYRENGDTFDVDNYSWKLKAAVWDDKLFICPQTVKFVNTESHTPLAIGYYNNNTWKDHRNNPLALWSISLERGDTSQWMYPDVLSGADTSVTLYKHIAADIVMSPRSDSMGTSRLVVMCSNGTTWQAGVHSPNQGVRKVGDPTDLYRRNFPYSLDVISKFDGSGLDVVDIPVLIHMSGVTPDESKYSFKRFRSIEIQGKFPEYNLFFTGANFSAVQLTLLVDAGEETDYNVDLVARHSSSDVVRGLLISQDLASYNDSQRINILYNVRGYRYGLNQRAKSLNIVFKSVPPANLIPQDIDSINLESRQAASLMSINDVRLMWTPTRRGPTNDPVDKS